MEPVARIELRRTRDLGQMVNLVFEFLRQNFKLLAKSLLFIVGPVALLVVVFAGYLITDVFSMMGSGEGEYGILANFGRIALPMAGIVLGTLVATIFMAGTVNEFVVLYIRRGPGEFDVPDVWQALRSDFWLIVGTLVGSLLMIGAVSMLIVVAVTLSELAGVVVLGVLVAIAAAFALVYLYIPLTLIVTLRIWERCSFFTAVRRSFELVKGKWWSSFALLVLIAIILMFASFVFQIPQYIVMAIAGATSLDNLGPYAVAMAVAYAFSMFGSFLLNSVTFLASALQYFNRVERMEGAGAIERIGEIGEGAIAGEEA